MLEVHQFPCLQDNYGFLIRDQKSGLTATIDTPDVEAISRALDEKNWQLSYILNTHHHFDHAGGNLALKERYGCQVVGFGPDRARLPGLDIEMQETSCFELGATKLEIFETPGHTLGHIVYLSRTDKVAFVGDTLFALGCGRLFEGTPAQMWASLQKIMQWPDDTTLYCAHEYTAANADFALSVEPDNADLLERVEVIKKLRLAGEPTVPTVLGLEKATNPFLRPESKGLQGSVGLTDASLTDVFAETRRLKDNF